MGVADHLVVPALGDAIDMAWRLSVACRRCSTVASEWEHGVHRLADVGGLRPTGSAGAATGGDGVGSCMAGGKGWFSQRGKRVDDHGRLRPHGGKRSARPRRLGGRPCSG